MAEARGSTGWPWRWVSWRSSPWSGSSPFGPTSPPSILGGNSRFPKTEPRRHLVAARLPFGFVYVLIVVAIIVLLFQFRSQAGSTPALTLSDLASSIKASQVKSIQVDGDTLHVTYNDEHVADTRKEPITTAPEQLLALGVTQQQLGSVAWDIKKPSDLGGVLTFLGYMLPALLVVGVIYFMLRQAQGTNNQALSFGKSRARMFTGDQPSVTFEDVAGVDEAKEELKEVVEFLKEPEKFISLGARIPKGVLLIGSPGTGKTLLAKAVSGEAGVPFFSISGSEFVEMFVGVGASRVRDLFYQGKRHSPCIAL